MKYTLKSNQIFRFLFSSVLFRYLSLHAFVIFLCTKILANKEQILIVLSAMIVFFYDLWLSRDRIDKNVVVAKATDILYRGHAVRSMSIVLYEIRS